MPSHEEMLAWERLLTSIGEQLNGEWELKLPDDDNWHKWGSLLNHAEQIYLTFYVDSYRKKLWIGVELPKDSKGKPPYISHLGTPPKIGLSPDKPAELIVRDINRRLLPEYLPLLEQAKRLVAEADAYHNTVETVARQIATITRGTIGRDNPSHIDFYHSPLPVFHEQLNRAEVHSDDVKLELRLGHQDALDLLKYLANR